VSVAELLAGHDASVDLTIRLSSGVAAAGIAINAAEMIYARKAIFRFFDWGVIRLSYPFMGRRTGTTRALDVAGGNNVLLSVVALQSVAAIGAALATGPLRATCAVLVFAVQLLVHMRLVYGFDGSDQMQTVVWGGIAAYTLMSSPVGRICAICFIAFQFSLSYWAAGIAKLVSPVWRSGDALPLIFRTEAYGAGAARRLVGWRPLAVLGCWAVMILEVLGPFATLFGKGAALGLIAAAIVFHASIAWVMGLNSFVFAFFAALPCIYFVGQMVQRWW
jgi:hypothetical protein